MKGGYNFRMIETAKSALGLGQYCMTASAVSPPCDRFWLVTGAAIALIVVATVMTIYLRHRARSRRAIALWDAEMRHQDEVAPELRMQHAAWKGDAAPEMDEREVAEQIRRALQNRKLNGRD